MKLLMVAADAMEFPGILARARNVRRAAVAADWSRDLELGDYRVRLVANGAGAKRASAATAAALETFAADAVISTGFCGGLNPKLALASIVCATEIAAGDLRISALLPAATQPHHRAVVCSIDHVAQTALEKARLHAAGADVVEMEAGGVAQIAAARALAFYCIRTVTDLGGEDMANDFNRALRADGHFATMSILRGTLRDPFIRIPELIRLRQRCVRAARALGEFIADCRF